MLALEKINNLSVEDTLNGATKALAEIESAAKTLKGAASEIETLLAADEVKNLPARIDDALAELNETVSGFSPESVFYRDFTAATRELNDSLRSIKVLADSIDRKTELPDLWTRFGKNPTAQSQAMMTFTTPIAVSFAAVALLTGGCASNPDRFYRLSADGTMPSSASGESPSIGLGPVKIPDYIDRSELVFKTSDHRFEVPPNHLWAGALDKTVTDVLATNLSHRLGTKRRS